MPVVELKNVSKTYETSSGVVLDDMSLSIDAGTFVAITGPSGCGKTTLLNLIGAIDHPTSGRLQSLGVDLVGASDRDLAAYRRRIGIVFQAFFLSPHRTTLDNVLLALAFGDSPLAGERSRALEALAKVGLEPWTTRPAGVLSGGQRQRVALARALVTRPSLLLADEPVGQLDAASRDAMIDLLRSYQKESGATVIVVTHESELVTHADTTFEMSRGRLAEVVRAS